MPPRDLVPIKSAAAEFGVGVSSLYRYVKDGKVAGYRRAIGAGVFLDRNELRRLSNFRRVTPEKPQ